MNLISDQLRDSINAAMEDVFDTFSRAIKLRFYKSPEEVIVFDPNFSSRWDAGNNKNIKIEQMQEFECVVTYEERQPFENFIQGANTNVRYEGHYNRIRVKMKLDAYEYLKETQRFVFDGVQYALDGSFRGLGFLKDFRYYEVILKRVN